MLFSSTLYLLSSILRFIHSHLRPLRLGGYPPYPPKPPASDVISLTGILFTSHGMQRGMAYLGIGYTGDDPDFLRSQVESNLSWLKGDRVPRFFGDRFLVLYDSNTAREFARICLTQAPEKSIHIYPMEPPLH